MPFKVVKQTPIQIALHRQAFGCAVSHALGRRIDKGNAAAVVGGGDAVFGDDQITTEILRHPAQHMGKALGVVFIIHLGLFLDLRHGQGAVRADDGAGIVLHAQEIVLRHHGQIVGEFLIPFFLCLFLPAGDGLHVMQAQGPAHFDVGSCLPNGPTGGGMCLHDNFVAVGCAGRHEGGGLFGTEGSKVFFGQQGIALHQILQVHAHLHLARRHHLLENLPGHGGDLDAHVGLVDGADVLQLAAKLLRDIPGIPGKIGGGSVRLPAALADQPDGAGKVMQGHDGLQAVFLAAADHIPVMRRFLFAEYAFLRLDPRPFDGKAIGVQPGFRHQLDILFIAVVVVAGNPAGLHKAGMGHLFLRPIVAVRIIALHLMGRCGRAQQEILFKPCHGFLLLFMNSGKRSVL